MVIVHVTKDTSLVYQDETLKAVCGLEFSVVEENYNHNAYDIDQLDILDVRKRITCDACMLVLFEENLL